MINIDLKIVEAIRTIMTLFNIRTLPEHEQRLIEYRLYAILEPLCRQTQSMPQANPPKPERCLCGGIGCNSCEPQGRG